jgi:hypothetical protein
MSQLAEREIQQLARTERGNKNANRVRESDEREQAGLQPRPLPRGLYVNLVKEQLPVVRDVKNVFVALCDKVMHILSGKPKEETQKPTPRIASSVIDTAYFERLQSRTIKAQAYARAFVTCAPAATGVSFGAKPAKQRMAGSVLAIRELVVENGITKTVVGRVEEVTDRDVAVNFSDPQIGWYTLSVPSVQFQCIPLVNSQVEIEVLYEAKRGIVSFGKPNVLGPAPAIKVRTDRLPEKPKDYEDPQQLEGYTAKLRKRLRLA